MYNAALFWADKVVALTNGKPYDVYWLAQCMFLLKQYHRATHLIKSHNLHKVNYSVSTSKRIYLVYLQAYVLCNNLAARCLLESNELTDALNVINEFDTKQLLELSSNDPNVGLFDNIPKHV